MSLQLAAVFQEWRADHGALPDENQRFGVDESLGEFRCVFDMIGPHRDVVTVEPFKALERSEGVEVVIEDRHFHAAASTFHRLPDRWRSVWRREVHGALVPPDGWHTRLSEPTVSASALMTRHLSFGSRESAWFADSLAVARCSLIPTGRV